MSKELKKAILWGVLAETISFTLLRSPIWFEKSEYPLQFFLLGIFGGWLNLPAIIINVVGFLILGALFDFLGLNVIAQGEVQRNLGRIERSKKP